jgi:Cu+-exporting ATPase
MEPDIRAADRDMLEIDALEQKGVLGSGKLPGMFTLHFMSRSTLLIRFIEQEMLRPRLQALLTAYEEDAKLVASLETRIASLVQRHGTYVCLFLSDSTQL